MSPQSVSVRHRLEYLLYRGAATLPGSLGERRAERLGAALGVLAYRRFGIRAELVRENLRRSFPKRDDAWVDTIGEACYRHLGREAMAMLRMAGETAGSLRARLQVEGDAAAKAALRQGRGLVLVTGHVGNWELAGATPNLLGMPMDVVVQRQSNPLVDRAIVGTRERLGMRVIERRQAPRRALQALRAGRTAGFVADQDARRAGVFVPFFGRLASTHRGPALLALRSGAPLFLGTILRLPGGMYEARFEEIDVSREGPADEAVVRLTAAYTERLEAVIRRAPEQYFWLHKRWKTRPPEEQPSGASGTKQGLNPVGEKPS